MNKHYSILLTLLLLLVYSCIEERESVRINLGEELNTMELKFNELSRFKKDTLISITSLTKIGDFIYGFDWTDGSIRMIDINNMNEVRSTGSSGKGPNQYNIDMYAELGSCNDRVFAYDWGSARIHLYDKNLNSYEILNLMDLPYNVSCKDNEFLTVQYIYTNNIDHINFDGEIKNTFKLDDQLEVNEEKFFRYLEIGDRHFKAYMFKPTIELINRENAKEYKAAIIIREIGKRKAGTRTISKVGDDIHIYFYDFEMEHKMGYAFDSNGNALYKYKIPKNINLLHFLNNTELLTVENGSSEIVKYRYSFE